MAGMSAGNPILLKRVKEHTRSPAQYNGSWKPLACPCASQWRFCVVTPSYMPLWRLQATVQTKIVPV